MLQYLISGTIMRLLILDIDGVMNSTRSAIGWGGFGYMPLNINAMSYRQVRHRARFDPVAVGILRRILRETRCKVLISSVWRMGATLKELRHLFAAYDLPPVIIGKTGRSPDGFRGREVRAWLREHRHWGINDYLILDDDSDFFRWQQGRLVKTQAAIGLDYPAYQFITHRWPNPAKRKPHPSP
jgi:HAD domain in Swiss Army Knife RNA repair proteins